VDAALEGLDLSDKSQVHRPSASS